MIKKRNLDSLQLYKEDKKNWLYNSKNDRLIVSSQPLEEYIETIEDESNPLHNFYVAPRKKIDFLNIRFLYLTFDSKKINLFYKAVIILNKWYLTVFFLIFCILFSNKVIPYIPSASNISLRNIVISYFIVFFVILPLHEYSHFSIYHKKFQTSRITFGLSLKYFSIIAFFTKVPFYPTMNRKEKIELALAGIKIQIFLWFLLTTTILLFPSVIVSEILILNLGLIVINLIPIIHLDGYWILSEIMNVDNYMKYFRKMFKKIEKFRIDVFIFGMVNIAAIASIIIYFLYSVASFIIQKGIIR